MRGISTHILDLTSGRPAAGVAVRVMSEGEDRVETLAECSTDHEGRIRELVTGENFHEGFYRLRFDTGAYFQLQDVEALHPCVEIVIEVRDSSQHYHVPLLLTPHSYSTYRGS
jgi:5-hydroxyisourate hydrolase